MQWKLLSLGPTKGDQQDYFFEEFNNAKFKKRKYVTAVKNKWQVGQIVDDPR